MDSAPICSFFAQGRCRHGDSCRFRHVAPEIPGTPSVSGTSSAPQQAAPPKPPPCSFFARGACRDGANCRFSHEVAQPQPAKPSPAPTNVKLPPGAPLFSIDVECVATGVQHHDRSVAQISLVNDRSEALLNLYVRPEKAVVSYLTPLTGLTAEHLDAHGVLLEEAVATLRSQLPPNAVLVGQNILKDVEWLGLVEGKDFGSMVDLAALLRAWNPKFGSFTMMSQDHYAGVWLGLHRTEADAHDAVADAIISMRLFHAYAAVQHDAAAVAAQATRVLATPAKPSFAKLNPVFEGCCQGNRQTCKCGAPFFS